MKQYKELVEDMKKITFEVTKSQTFHTALKETMSRYSDGAVHWIPEYQL